jgi:tetratricopeptide (TPR) repeat protein
MARGRLADQMGLGAEAMAQFLSAVAGNPSDGRARAQLANTAMRQGKWTVAADQFSALLAMGYQPARSHYGLGRVAEASGDRTRAIKEYRRALQLEPGLGIARDALARVEKP